LLGPEVADVDGNIEERHGTVSIFNGPAPAVRTFKSQQEENDAVAAWLADRCREGVPPHEFGIFVRSDAELDRARTAVAKTGMPSNVLDEHVETTSGQISIGTMHLAKGLEFRAVVVMACDDEIIPLQSRIETGGRRHGPGRSLQHRTAFALRGLHTCPGPLCLLRVLSQDPNFLMIFRFWLLSRALLQSALATSPEQRSFQPCVRGAALISLTSFSFRKILLVRGCAA
jgi:hypothetical protein